MLELLLYCLHAPGFLRVPLETFSSHTLACAYNLPVHLLTRGSFQALLDDYWVTFLLCMNFLQALS